MTTQAVATVLGGFWPANGVTSLSGVSGEGTGRRLIARTFGRRGLLAMREITRALVGVAPGGTATKTITRVSASQEMGGARPIETVTLVNRATTSGDQAEIIADFLTQSSRTTFGSSAPINGDRNPLGTR